MKAKEIEQKLQNGEKLIHAGGWFNTYSIGSETVANRLNVNQFEKYKLKCKNKDESEKERAWFRGQSYRLFYWL
jgi:hypothetical protein